jgi:hypothetical protein
MPKKMEPGLTKDGKKDWKGFFASMTDKEVMAYTVASLAKMPMTYLRLLGERLSKIQK